MRKSLVLLLIIAAVFVISCISEAKNISIDEGIKEVKNEGNTPALKEFRKRSEIYLILTAIYRALDSISTESADYPHRINGGEFIGVESPKGLYFIGTLAADKYEIGRDYILWNRLGERFSISFEEVRMDDNTILTFGIFQGDKGVDLGLAEARLKNLFRSINVKQGLII